jgi:hypothetical protein
MGLKIMTKSKNRPTKWQFFYENHQLGKVVKMKGTDSSFVPGVGNVKDRRGGSTG